MYESCIAPVPAGRKGLHQTGLPKRQGTDSPQMGRGIVRVWAVAGRQRPTALTAERWRRLFDAPNRTAGGGVSGGEIVVFDGKRRAQGQAVVPHGQGMVRRSCDQRVTEGVILASQPAYEDEPLALCGTP